MFRQDYSKVYWPRIENGEHPYFDVVLELIKIFKEESKRELYADKSVIYRSISMYELRKRLRGKNLGLTPVCMAKAVITFLDKKNIEYEQKSGPSSKYSIAFTREKLKDLEKWTQSVQTSASMRYLFSS